MVVTRKHWTDVQGIAQRNERDGSTSPTSPTAGCTAMGPADIAGLFEWLQPKMSPLLVQMPEAQYERYRDLWHVPSRWVALLKADVRCRFDINARHRTGQVRQVLVVFGDDVLGGEWAVVDGGMRIAGQNHVITQLQRLAHGGVDAIVSLQAADHQPLNILHRHPFKQ